MLAVFGDHSAYEKCGDDGVVEDVSREESQHVAVEIVSIDAKERMQFSTPYHSREQGHACVGKRRDESEKNENSCRHGPWPMTFLENAKKMVS